jgi:hypothetical protein
MKIGEIRECISRHGHIDDEVAFVKTVFETSVCPECGCEINSNNRFQVAFGSICKSSLLKDYHYAGLNIECPRCGCEFKRYICMKCEYRDIDDIIGVPSVIIAIVSFFIALFCWTLSKRSDINESAYNILNSFAIISAISLIFGIIGIIICVIWDHIQNKKHQI